jgi:hypothetical protein
MQNVQEVIVYRSPAEAEMWEYFQNTGAGTYLFIFILSALVGGIVAAGIEQLFGSHLRWQWQRYGKVCTIVVVGFIVATVMFAKL